jgi:hypothetical protein
MMSTVGGWLRSFLSARPLWSRLRGVSNSSVAKATVLIPLIGYLVLFNGQVIQYLNLVRELGGQEGATVSYRLIFIYFGLCAIAVAVSIYGWYCPNEVKHYGSASAFVQGDGPSLRGYLINDITVTLSKDKTAREKLEELSQGLEYKKNTATITNEDRDNYRLENLHLYFNYLDESHPTARRLVFTFYVLGLVFLGVPSLHLFANVLVLLVGKLW